MKIKKSLISGRTNNYYEMYIQTDSNDADYHYFNVKFYTEEMFFFAFICLNNRIDENGSHGSWNYKNIISQCKKHGIDIEKVSDASVDDIKVTDDEFEDYLDESIHYLLMEDWYSDGWGTSKLCSVDMYMYEDGNKYSVTIE